MGLTQVKTSGIADDAITEAKVANDAISPTEMKAGTDGHIITYDASGNPTTIGPGTDGQVLTSTGAGSPPAFENAASSGAALTGSTNNTVCTVTGANAIQGESNLTFDGDTLATVKMSCTVGGDVTGSTWNRTDANEAWVSHRFYTQSNGSGHIQVNVGSVTYSTSSDYRLKENIVDLTGAIARVKTLKPKRFNFKMRPADTLDGFLAHEVTTVPEATTGTKDEVDSDGNPVYQGIDQSKIVPLLTAALQEAIAKIETLETKVAALESG